MKPASVSYKLLWCKPLMCNQGGCGDAEEHPLEILGGLLSEIFLSNITLQAIYVWQELLATWRGPTRKAKGVGD